MQHNSQGQLRATSLQLFSCTMLNSNALRCGCGSHLSGNLVVGVHHFPGAAQTRGIISSLQIRWLQWTLRQQRERSAHL